MKNVVEPVVVSNYIEKFEYINNPDNTRHVCRAAVEQYRESFANLEATGST